MWRIRKDIVCSVIRAGRPALFAPGNFPSLPQDIHCLSIGQVKPLEHYFLSPSRDLRIKWFRLRRIKAIAIASEAAILVLLNTTEFPAAGKVDDKQNCPAGVVSQGEKEMASVPVERRRYRRSVFPSNIEYSMKAEANSETFKGVAVDISESGLCIYTSHVLKESQEIAIISVLPVPSRTATVRWTKRLNEDLSKAGLMFVK